jgi:hypothetical protein
MKIVAAFYWDVSQKSVSALLVEEQGFAIKFGPKKWDCKDPNWSVFATKASSAINDFFVEIDKERTLGNQVKVNFKLVSPAGPITHYGHTTGPGKHSAFVDGIFRPNLTSRNLINHRVRSSLSGDTLFDFKEGLRFSSVISSNADSFKHRVWAVALKATKKTAVTRALSVWHALIKPSAQKKDAKKEFQVLLEQARSRKNKK